MTNESQAVEVYRDAPQTTAVALWGTDDPAGMIERMTSVADAMSVAVRARGMTVTISGREYVLAEGWSMVGAMVGVFARPRTLDEIREGDTLVGFRATVDLVTRDGGVCGGAVALCTVDENGSRDLDWNQIASKAQTRAMAKAYRQTLGFIMPMAKFAATPADEMDDPHERPAPRPQAPRTQQDTGDIPAMRNTGDFLTACRTLGLGRDEVVKLHGCRVHTELASVMEGLGSWEELFAATKRLKDAVPA